MATRNAGKIYEITAVLAKEFDYVTLADLQEIAEAEENSDSIEQNALIKARHAFKATGLVSLADDSGLFVTVLSGRPGPVSARYGCNDHERMARLLDELCAWSDRRATFRCAIAVVWSGDEKIFLGECEGLIAKGPRGKSGFGYDPVFIPKGYDKTFAELGDEIKNRISHRAKALLKAKKYLLKIKVDSIK